MIILGLNENGYTLFQTQLAIPEFFHLLTNQNRCCTADRLTHIEDSSTTQLASFGDMP
jgi:hypothetical protein